ncbi:MAG: hypothetical protein M1814_004893 [Vezdaea aestivalis]|nr:MAG: hypothetical protein M1814_004893 [Vezdaea aestivalis]
MALWKENYLNGNLPSEADDSLSVNNVNLSLTPHSVHRRDNTNTGASRGVGYTDKTDNEVGTASSLLNVQPQDTSPFTPQAED